ncbi:MAG TPA: sulfatase, partial [Bacteroidales bacterium]|nr:sulfatase [Bacteroidales bacterium]
PGEIEAGFCNDAIISLTDIFATFAGLTCNTNISGGEDSHNMLDIMKGKDYSQTDELPRVFHSSKGIFAIRKGQWKFIQGDKGNGNPRIMPHKDSLDFVGQLYDLSSDPYETNDLWEEKPEKVKELLDLLNQIKSN